MTPGRKELFLLRHAEAIPASTGMSDFDRPLSEKGCSDARRIGLLMKELSLNPEVIFTSTALRAHTTANLVAEVINGQDKLVPLPRLYDSTLINLLVLIGETDAKFQRIMLVGHNPTFAQFVDFYAAEGLRQLPPAGLVHLAVYPSKGWSGLIAKQGILLGKWSP